MLACVHLLWMPEAYKRTMKGLCLSNGFTNDQVIYSLEMISQRWKQGGQVWIWIFQARSTALAEFMPPDWSCSQDKQYFPGWKNETIFCKEVPLFNDLLAAATPKVIAMPAVINGRILMTFFLWSAWEQDRIVIAIPCSWQLPDFMLKNNF